MKFANTKKTVLHKPYLIVNLLVIGLGNIIDKYHFKLSIKQ